MTTVALDRRFYEWSADADWLAHSRYRAAAGISDGMLGWLDLLAKRRVVILAEAGSGKTEELVEQARLQTAAGKLAFYATVQDVGRDGLDKALRPAERPRLELWRKSSEPGWFFIDSIDEAKLDNIRLERALRQIADGIGGNEGRAHIILSGRHTDWEFARDARRLNKELPLPRESMAEPVPPLETLIRRILRHEKPPEPTPAETPLIVVMAPLDADKVRTYAAAKDAPALDGLIEAIQAANMWEFARRPLDLDWIVRYWRDHGRLGSFTEMIEASLHERAQEANPDRARRDRLDAERAQRGLERIGAALVFGRQTTIAIPDNDAPLEEARTALMIDAVLPDWSSEDRLQLLTRPAFDPATFGRARLHNDNEGVIRAYLAARWLLRLRQTNLPRRRLHDFLFSRTYGIELVKPSMLETAAWLSLWDESVATEVIRRTPFLLFTAGDPASLLQPTRRAVLTALIERMRRGDETPLLDLDSLARFAQPDIVPGLRTIWESDNGNVEIRRLILRLIWLGKLTECADLAEAASFGQYPDLYTAITAGRALIATGDDRQQRAYADYIKQNCALLSTTVVWEAVDELFPRLIGIDDLLPILATIRLGDGEGGGFNMDWNGVALVSRLKNTADLVRLIEGLLAHLEAEPHDLDSDDDSSRDAQYATTLAAAAARLLDLSPPNIAPEAAIDAVLRIGDRRFDRTPRRLKKGADAVEQLHRTPERRRAAFWRAADRLGNHRILTGRPLLHSFQMNFLGWPSGLVLEDIDWLLADAPGRERISERQLAINAALALWFNEGQQNGTIKARISAVAATDSDMQNAYTEWMTPRAKSAEEIKNEEEMERTMRKGERVQAKREQSWIDFVTQMRADPTKLVQLLPTAPNTVDGRVYDLWQLLHQAVGGSSHYAIDTVAPIVEIAGQEVATAFADRLADIWRSWKPRLHSERPPEERNQIGMIDCMCIAGVSIEAASQPNWASHLTEMQAIRAAEYATLELNGFPDWIGPLAAAWPAVVEQVLAKEAASDLDNPTPGVDYRILEYTSRGPESLIRLMSPALWRELQARPGLNQLVLRPLLPILVRGLPEVDKGGLYALALHRFQNTDDPGISSQYLGAAYAINAHGATDALVAKLDRLGEAERTILVERVLPQIFGSPWSRSEPSATVLDLPTLELLVLLAFRIVRIEEDRDRANKGVYSPDERDTAQEARSAAFKALVSMPGAATFKAILRLISTPGFPIPASRLRSLAYERASKDAEHTAWAAGEARQVEEQFERPPVTGRELQLVALQRLEDLQHDLLEGDFQQGTTLHALPDEPAVQNWVADRLRHMQGSAYSIEREPHVAEEKEPDLRFRGKASDANVAIEIKVAESWTLSQLEDALVKQLCGQYLRAQGGREGILLLVHQTPRSKGWQLSDGTFLSFDALVQRLRDLAATIRSSSSSGPLPEIGMIDVSSCASPVVRHKPARKLSVRPRPKTAT
ncbi:conserved hypothetical protein [Thiomonas arsenitoxydans]|uniref:ATP-binding protein n=1 Tax=Thiomonas arsenitoxydans (strain DSM 22701 / CIP 110005 / 3As) TaxID=426114 RepID=A0ABM9T8Q6_THIA3|nr:hypothetical protein [Thiomonas arsenitoxydans]CQR38251.1 conserved hypothetical protein [Thiomonas arsenitoxydans]CQR39195.1 conserved hypothetical protein [Thiomonas arsenitoxydans]